MAGALALDEQERGEFEAAARSGPRSLGGSAITIGPWVDATSNLPLALTSFVGRDEELAEIATLAREHRLVTLTGTGGVGKTQTALRAASALSDEVTLGFVGFAPISDPTLVVAVIASALRVQEVPNRPLLDTVSAYLRNRTMLLVFDNCEHVIAEVANVAGTLLLGCPGVRILATSREPMKAAGEHAYRLPSLDRSSAVALFGDRARAVDHHFALTKENTSVVAEICHRLDGIPLAIELAAARVSLLPVEALAERLGDRLTLLSGGDRTALPRQRTMRATIEWSYDLLSAEEKRVFERLSVFAGGFTLDTAAVVCAEDDATKESIFELLSCLIDKSLLVGVFDASEPQYQVLESFRQFARDKLASRGEQFITSHRHALAYLDLAERLERAAENEPDSTWRAIALRELDNWRAALQWALRARRDVLLGLEMVCKLLAVWVNFALLEGRAWIASAMELANGLPEERAMTRLNHAEAAIAFALGEHKQALERGRAAAEAYRATGDALGGARAERIVGLALMFLGQRQEAGVVLQEALRVARRSHDPKLVASTLRALGNLSAIEGDVNQAKGFIAEALQSYESVGAELEAARTMDDLASLEASAGNVELAVRYSADATVTLRAFNDVRGIANALGSTAASLLLLGRYDAARDYAIEALELARSSDFDVMAAWQLQHLAAIMAMRPQVAADNPINQRSKATRVLGFVDARLAMMGSVRIGNQPREYRRVLCALQTALGPSAVAELMSEGARMTEEQADREAQGAT